MAELSLEQRRALALAAVRARMASETIAERGYGGAPPPPGPRGENVLPRTHPGAMEFLNRGISTALGAPVDLVNTGLGMVGMGSEEPILGIRNIADLIGNITPVAGQFETPETMGQSAAEGMGLAAGTLLPGGGATAGLIRAGGPVARGVGKTLAEPFLTRPIRATALELAAGAGAGAGGEFAERKNASRIVGELLGGGVAAVAPSAAISGAVGAAKRLPLSGFLTNVGRAVQARFTKGGAFVRASRRIRDLSGDPQADAALVTGDTISGQSQAVETGNPRLMALERAVLDADSALDREYATQSAEGADALRAALREPAGDAAAGDARAFIQQRREYLESLLEQRVLQAEEMATQRVAALGPRMDETVASAIVKEELDAALKAARATERELWGLVPESVLVPTGEARKQFQVSKAQLKRARQKNLPDVAVELLDPDKSNTVFKSTEPAGEMYALMSELREVARIARFDKKANRARISDDIADAVLKDLEGSDVGRQAFDDVQDTLDLQTEVDTFFARFSEVENAVAGLPKRPVAGELLRRGGVAPMGPLAVELKATGITPRTHPGLYRRGGLQSADNIPFDEVPGALEHGLVRGADENVTEQSIIDALRDEAGGSARLTAEQQALLSEQADLTRQLPEFERHRADIGSARVERPFPGDFTDAEVSGPLTDARAFSRQLNQTFRQGNVGRLLGSAKEGGEAIAADLTLGTTLGRGGAPAKVALREIQAAVGGSENARAAMQDFLRRRFTEFSSPRGEFRPERAVDFLRQNSEMLDGFPALKREVTQAAESGRFASDVRSTVDIGIKEAGKSPGAAFVQSPVEREFLSILQARNPRKAARAVAREAAKDETGQATRGLKAAALDHLMERAGRGGDLSGKALRALMMDRRTGAALAEIMSSADMRHIGRVTKELMNAEMRAGKLPGVGGVLNDTVNTALSFIATTLAARGGAKLGGGISGASLKTASAASSRAQKLLKFITNDKAQELLKEAMQNTPEGRELFKALLMPLGQPASVRQVSRILGPYLGAEVGQAAGDLREGAQ